METLLTEGFIAAIVALFTAVAHLMRFERWRATYTGKVDHMEEMLESQAECLKEIRGMVTAHKGSLQVFKEYSGNLTLTIHGLEEDVSEHGERILVLEKYSCLLYTSPSPRDRQKSRMPSSA